MILTVEPTQIGPYTVLKLLGRGGQAVVYLCSRSDSDEEVAVKLMTSTSGSGDERFRREILLSRLLAHPNIVRILDDGVHEGAPYVAMEVLPNSLEGILRDLDGDPLDGLEVSRLALGIARGLSNAHARGVVHRDLKPDNVLLSADGTPKIADFGIARALDLPGMTRAGTVMGTPSYMSPEQAAGLEVDPRSDIYSFGCLVFRMITGRTVFLGDQETQMRQHRNDNPPSPIEFNPDTPEQLSEIIKKCLEKDKRKRFADADELVASLLESIPGISHAVEDQADPEQSWAETIIDAADSAAESLTRSSGLISRMEAEIIASERARLDSSFYQGVAEPSKVIRSVVESGTLDGDDAYEIIFSFRPSWDFEGESGIERFVLDRSGRLISRAIVREPGVVTPIPAAVPVLDEPAVDNDVVKPDRPEFASPIRSDRSGTRRNIYISILAIAVLSISGVAVLLTTAGSGNSTSDPQTGIDIGASSPVSNMNSLATSSAPGSLAISEDISVDRIAFVSDRDGNAEIYVMNNDGTAVTRLTANSTEDWQPAWSPDGSRIAFSSNRDGNFDIYVMNADGTGVIRLTGVAAWDKDPTWSPDGTRIAFSSNRSSDWDIYVINADGSGLRQLASADAALADPDWSPDGTQIAYTSKTDSLLRSEIYVMNADGTEQTRLTNNGDNDYDPTWSPDGSTIAYVSNVGGNDGGDRIYVMDADGINQIRLTSEGASDYDPSWSPDGSRIAFFSFRGGNFDIYLMNADGSGVTRLSNDGALNREPSWGPEPGTAVLASAPAPAAIPTPTGTPKPTVTPTPAPAATATATPTPEPTATSDPTSTPAPIQVPLPVPTQSSKAVPTPTSTAVPTQISTVTTIPPTQNPTAIATQIYPSEPRSVRTAYLIESVIVFWDKPLPNDGGPIIGYEIQVLVDGQPIFGRKPILVEPTETSIEIASLPILGSSKYGFDVRSINKSGMSNAIRSNEHDVDIDVTFVGREWTGIRAQYPDMQLNNFSIIYSTSMQRLSYLEYFIRWGDGSDSGIKTLDAGTTSLALYKHSYAGTGIFNLEVHVRVFRGLSVKIGSYIVEILE